MTAPLVASGTKAGVLTVPWARLRVPVRASESRLRVLTVNTIQTYRPPTSRYDHALMRRGIVIIVCCLGLAACGGSGSGKASKTVTVTSGSASNSPAANAAFSAQLSSICKKANAAYIKAGKPSAQVAVIQHYLTVFNAVKAPPALDSAYALYLAVLGKELRALKRGDSAGLIKIRDTQAGPLVRQLGATGCYG